jgi:hypothetical protein
VGKKTAALPRLLELCGCPLKTDDCNYVELMDGPEYHYNMEAKMSDEDRMELQNEDEELHAQLEVLMQVYKRKCAGNFGPFSVFWIDWWATLDMILPEKEDIVLEVVEEWAGIELHAGTTTQSKGCSGSRMNGKFMRK